MWSAILLVFMFVVAAGNIAFGYFAAIRLELFPGPVSGDGDGEETGGDVPDKEASKDDGKD